MKTFNTIADIIAAELSPGQYVECINEAGTDRIGARFFIEESTYVPELTEGDITLSNGNHGRYVQGINRNKITTSEGVIDKSSINEDGKLTDTLEQIKTRDDGQDATLATQGGEIAAHDTRISDLETEVDNISVSMFPNYHMDTLGLRLERVNNTQTRITAGQYKTWDNTIDAELTTALIKDISLDWAEGDSQGAFPSGLTLNAGWYRVFLIAKADGTTDWGFDTANNAINLLADAAGAGYIKYRRRGWMYWDGAKLEHFIHKGVWDFEWVNWSGKTFDQNKNAATGPRAPINILVPPNCDARISGQLGIGSPFAATDTDGYKLVFTGENQTDVAPSEDIFTLIATQAISSDGWIEKNIAEFEIRTNSNSQIYYRSDRDNIRFRINPKGWRDSGLA